MSIKISFKVFVPVATQRLIMEKVKDFWSSDSFAYDAMERDYDYAWKNVKFEVVK